MGATAAVGTASAAGGSTAGGAAAGGAGGATAGGSVADAAWGAAGASDIETKSAPTTAGDSSSVAGGILDIISPASYVGMAQTMAAREEQQRQFDANFWENKRRFGIELALKEFSLRHNIAMSAVQAMWQRGMSALGGIQGMRSATLQRRGTEKQLAEQARKKQITQNFMKGFNSIIQRKIDKEPSKQLTGGA